MRKLIALLMIVLSVPALAVDYTKPMSKAQITSRALAEFRDEHGGRVLLQNSDILVLLQANGGESNPTLHVRFFGLYVFRYNVQSEEDRVDTVIGQIGCENDTFDDQPIASYAGGVDIGYQFLENARQILCKR